MKRKWQVERLRVRDSWRDEESETGREMKKQRQVER